MTNGLLLVGASGLAREILAAGITGVVGILDDDPELRDREIGGVPVLGAVSSAQQRDESLLVCIGPSDSRRSVVRRLSKAGVGDDRYAVYVARHARIGATTSIGPGSIVLEGAVTTADARIGRHVVIMPNCTVAHDAQLADFATVAAGVSLGGGARVGRSAYIGMNASLRQGIRVGENSIVGMGAVVLSDVPANETWAGVPARRLKSSAERE